MTRLAILLFGLLLSACGAQNAPQATGGERPMRIVSLDYCSDQFVLKFVDRERILAVSPDAEKQFSYMHGEADGLRIVRPYAENVMILKPDLVVRSYGGGPNAAAFFERAGVPVLDVGWAGDLEAVMAIVERMAAGLGEPEKGRAVAADMRARLANLSTENAGEAVLYMTPGGVTSGPGSLIDEMITTAGLTNFHQQPGWRALPLEELAYRQPDIVAAAFYETFASQPNVWSAAKHPVAQAQLAGRPVVALEGAWTSCGGWFLMDAIEALAEGGEK